MGPLRTGVNEQLSKAQWHTIAILLVSETPRSPHQSRLW